MSEEETNQMIQKIISDSSKESDDWSRCSIVRFRKPYSLYIWISWKRFIPDACMFISKSFFHLSIGPTSKTAKKGVMTLFLVRYTYVVHIILPLFNYI
jgi:hypothetical protein